MYSPKNLQKFIKTLSRINVNSQDTNYQLTFFLFLQKFLSMITIVDCGATKSEWVFIDGEKIVERYVTDGFNPNFCSLDLLSSITLENISNNIDIKDITNVYYYGSGCGNFINIVKIKNLLSGIFNESKVEVFSDVLAACHALFGNDHGIACILGTGSNACLYDGEKVIKNATSLGYILGDEGSGCHIGKNIVHDYFYGIMPADLSEKFNEKYQLTRDSLIETVYKSSQPSRYLAAFTKFASENIEYQYIIDIVTKCFDDFTQFYILPFNVSEKAGFVGSTAFYFQEILRNCLLKNGIVLGEIIQSPMDGLIKFYS